jgi:hypothetical protein
MHPLVIVFLLIWFGFALLIGGALFAAALFGSVEGDPRQVLIVVPTVIAGGIALVALGRFLGRKDEQYLLDFVRYMLDAR